MNGSRPPYRLGYWMVRQRLGPRQWGPPLPAAIVRVHTLVEADAPTNMMDRSPFLAAFVGGEPAGLYELQPWTDSPVGRIFMHLRDITKAEYDYQLLDLSYVKTWRPDDAKAKANEAVNLATAAPLYQRRA